MCTYIACCIELQISQGNGSIPHSPTFKSGLPKLITVDFRGSEWSTGTVCGDEVLSSRSAPGPTPPNVIRPLPPLHFQYQVSVSVRPSDSLSHDTTSKVQHGQTSTTCVSLRECHCGNVTAGVSLQGCHCGSVTAGMSLQGCHCRGVTAGVSLRECHCGRVLQ